MSPHAIEVVPERLDLAAELICSGRRQQRYSEARSLVAWLAGSNHNPIDLIKCLRGKEWHIILDGLQWMLGIEICSGMSEHFANLSVIVSHLLDFIVIKVAV